MLKILGANSNCLFTLARSWQWCDRWLCCISNYFLSFLKWIFSTLKYTLNLKERHDVIIQMNSVFPHNFVISPCFANLWLKNAFVDQFNNSQLKPFLLWSKSKIIPNHFRKNEYKDGHLPTLQCTDGKSTNPN